jgi:hypothetical protein
VNRLLRRLPHNAFNQRWGIWSSMTLTSPEGVVYLRRRRVFQTPWLALYVHDILTPDIDPDPHSHPFPFVSLVLRGGYVESVWYPREGDTELAACSQIPRLKGLAHTFPRGNGQVHRIDAVEPRTKTLVLAGRRRDSWGFFEPGVGMVPWKQHLEKQGREATGRRVHND